MKIIEITLPATKSFHMQEDELYHEKKIFTDTVYSHRYERNYFGK